MERREKFYLPKVSRLVDWNAVWHSAKNSFFNLLPNAKTIFLFGLFGLFGLLLQVFLVGTFDRFFGISPKISLLGSSLFFAALFSGLAIFGGLKRNEIPEVLETNLKTQPICKMLIIRRKKQEIKI